MTQYNKQNYLDNQITQVHKMSKELRLNKSLGNLIKTKKVKPTLRSGQPYIEVSENSGQRHRNTKRT
jgi:hypothetical protein